MRSLSLRATVIYISLSIFNAAAQQATVIYQGKQVVANQVILRLRNNDPQSLARVAARLASATVTPLSPSLGAHVIKSDIHDVAALMSYLGPDNDILYAEPNFVLHGTATPNDPQYSQMWAMGKIGAPQAWDVFTGSRSVAAGILDTGVDYTHPDLIQNVWSAPSAFSVNLSGQTLTCPAGSHGFNALAMSCDPKDDNSHGTHVSGTIGAAGNNGIGVAGVNWSTQIVAIKFLDSSGSGSLSDAINGIEFAMQLNQAFASSSTPVNIRVLSASWGSSDFSQTLLDELNKAYANGLLFVAAAGNAGTNNDTSSFYPAGYHAPNVISVAATDSNDALASFSDYGAASVHLGAPGVGILSTVSGGGYASYSGTSMATPHVAGAALLILGACPALSTDQLKATLLASADPVSSLQGKSISGGRLNASRAIQSCRSAQPSACLASVAADHWRGEYFNNMTLSGSPIMVRDDGTSGLNFNWGYEGSPGPSCNLPGTAFSVRWTRGITFSAGTYRFSTVTDDGMRLYVDGAKVMDRWFDQGATAATTDVAITGGTHTIVVEYYQNKGGAVASVSWQLTAPAVSACISTVAGDHWKGEYFGNMTLSGNPLMVRDDGIDVLNFNWGNEGSPSAACNVPGRQFSARWTRAVSFSGGTYAFTTSTDDGMRVYLDGQKFIDRWWDQGASASTTNVFISAGTHTLVVEYYQNTLGDLASVSWQLTGGAPSVTPLAISSVSPASVTAGTTPLLTISGSGLDASFRVFLVSGAQTTEIAAKVFISATSVQVTPQIGGSGDPNAKLQITVGTQSASIALPIQAPPGVTSVVITSPTAGASVSGSLTVSAMATTSPWLTITSVLFQLDGGNQGTALISSPYSMLMDTSRLMAGAHTLTAVATDSSGNSTTSAPVAFTVNTPAPPSASSLIAAFSAGRARNDYAGWVGMQFTVGAAPLRVTALGRIYVAGNSRSHVVKLVNAGDGADVAGASVTISLPVGAAGQFAYGQLANTVTLSPGTSYYLVSQETTGGDQWDDFTAVTAANAVAVSSPVIWTGANWYRPGILNASYGPVSLLYQ